MSTPELPFQQQTRQQTGDDLFRYMIGQPADAHGNNNDANHQALQRFRLLPRVLQGNQGISTEVTLVGQRWAAPIGVGAFAGDQIFHEEGVLPIARACKRLQLPLVISEETVTPMRVIGAEYDRCWLQLRAAGDMSRIQHLIAQAIEADFKGIVLTVLAPVHPVPGLQPGGFSVGEALKKRGMSTIGGHEPGVFSLPAFPVWNWTHIHEVAAFCTERGVPLLLKGILHHDDAAPAAQQGVSGLIASNIGLRQSARWSTPVDQLPDLLAVTRLPLLLDGGIRSGSDAVVACCLGAQLSLSVRPIISALVAGGEEAVFTLLNGWKNEIAAISHWSGVSTMSELNGSFLTEVRE